MTPRRFLTAREQHELLAPWRQANSAGGGIEPDMNVGRQVSRANARAQEARQRGEHGLADYLEGLRDHMLSQADQGYPRPWSHYEPMAHEEFDIPPRTAAAHPDSHLDLHESFARHGTVHTTGGRVLSGWRIAARYADFADPAGWTFHHSFEPSPHARQGAQAYSSLMGLPNPHDGTVDYLNARRTPDELKAAAQHYDSLPLHDAAALPHFDAMRREVGQQHDFMTNRLGIKTQTVDHDPYSDVHEMLADVNNNKRLQVLGTHATGGHPHFSDEENDKFRAVHDFFGHAATGRSFDRHGEQAAYLAHAQMFSPHARPALASETKGQNSSLIYNGSFGPQKIATMDPRHWAHDLSSLGRTAAAPAICQNCGEPKGKHTREHGNGKQHGTCPGGAGQFRPPPGYKPPLDIKRQEQKRVRGAAVLAGRAEDLQDYRTERHRQEVELEGLTGGHPADIADHFARGGTPLITYKDWLRGRKMGPGEQAASEEGVDPHFVYKTNPGWEDDEVPW